MAFVSIEGIDGAGKSTVIRLIAQRLSKVYVTKEPSDGPVGKLIKTWALKGGTVDPHVDALLFAADRIEHYRREIEPRLREGYLVLTERYVESSIAYQTAAGVSETFLKCINAIVPRPHLTVIVDIDPEEALRRVAQRGTFEKYEQLTFLTRVRQIYLRRAIEEGYKVVDASRKPEEVAEEVLEIITKTLEYRHSK